MLGGERPEGEDEEEAREAGEEIKGKYAKVGFQRGQVRKGEPELDSEGAYSQQSEPT